MVLRSKQGNQAYGHFKGIDPDRSEVMAESMGTWRLEALGGREGGREVFSLPVHRTWWAPIKTYRGGG